jgi:hypothetical protein
MDKNFFIIGKSAVNFCEYDSYWIGMGEPWNVFSSLVIIFFGIYGLYNVNCKLINLVNNLIKKEKKIQLNILYSLLAFIGLGSAFFHLKLSQFAHWIDIILISIILIFSNYVLSSNQNKLKNKLKYFLLLLIHFLTSIYIPQVHIFFLFATGFCIKNKIEDKIKLYNSIQFHTDNKLKNKYLLIKKIFILSLGFWILDYFGCILLSPYHVHWIFHILIGFISYQIIIFIKDLDYSH